MVGPPPRQNNDQVVRGEKNRRPYSTMWASSIQTVGEIVNVGRQQTTVASADHPQSAANRRFDGRHSRINVGSRAMASSRRGASWGGWFKRSSISGLTHAERPRDPICSAAFRYDHRLNEEILHTEIIGFQPESSVCKQLGGL